MKTPRAETCFPGGNGVDFEWPAADQLRFRANTHGGPYSMWFHFRTADLWRPKLLCELVGAHDALGWPYQPHVRTVYRRHGEPWRRVAWTEVDAEAGILRFEVSCRRWVSEVAFCYPYQTDHWRRFVYRHLLPFGPRAVTIGQTQRGRPLRAWEVGEGPHVVWLMARTHSGETPGSYTLEGIALGLLESAREGIGLRIVPFMDLDGVLVGMYGKGRPPVDFYEAWGEEVTCPEVEACKRYLEAMPSPPVIAVDCHAPTANDPHYMEHTVVAGADPSLGSRLRALVERVISECAPDPSTRICRRQTGPVSSWHTRGFEAAPAGYLQTRFGTLAFTLESAYHATHEGDTVSPAAWRRLGRAVARAILQTIEEEPA